MDVILLGMFSITHATCTHHNFRLGLVLEVVFRALSQLLHHQLVVWVPRRDRRGRNVRGCRVGGGLWLWLWGRRLASVLSSSQLAAYPVELFSLRDIGCA